MQPYSIATAGGYLKTTTSGSSQSTQWIATTRRVRFLNVSSSHGNFVDPTPFNFVKGEYGSLSGTTGMYGNNWSIVTDGYGPGDSCYVSNACDAAALDPYNKCLDKLYGKLRSDVDLSIDIYQGKQTVKMILDFYNAIRHPVDVFLKNGKKLIRDQQLTRVTKLAGSKWLEYQYGLAPTLSTIHSLTSELVGAISSPGGIQLVKARASTKDDRSVVRPVAGNYWSGSIPAKVDSHDSRRCEIALSYTIGNAQINALSQFSSLNPVSFIYENIPFSFVLDWAIDVGGYIRMMETALATGLVFKSGYRTDTRHRHGEVSVKGSASQYGTYYYSNMSGTWMQKEKSRVVLTSMPLPVLPSFAPRLGSERLLSAASLLSNFLSIKPSSRR